MSTHVGGRMETVAPIRVTDWSDRVRLLGLLLITLLLHTWLIRNSVMTARDSLGFAQLALNLAHPSGDPAKPVVRTLPDVLKDAKQPPAYPATIYATYYILHRIDPPDNRSEFSLNLLLRAAQIAAAGAMTLAVFPMYWLGRMLLDKNRSFAAVLLFQFLPVAARDTSDGLSEGLYFLGFATALALGVAGLRKESIGRFLLCGVASGLTYLVRPEGLAVTLGAAIVMVGLAVVSWRPRVSMLACTAALIVGTGISAAPYMLLIGGLTNKPSGKQAIEGPSGPMRPGFGLNVLNGPIFAEQNTDPDRGSGLQKASAVGLTMTREYLQASHYGVGILGIIGCLLIRKRFRTQPEWIVLLATVGVHLVALSRVAYSQGYASERHLLTATFVATYFTMAGLEPLFGWLARRPVIGGFYRHPAAMWVWVAVLIAVCIPSLSKPMHQNRIGFKQAGEFLAQEIQPEDRLTDPYEWSQYYAKRTTYQPPIAEERFVEYAVLRNGGDAEDKRLNQDLVEQAKRVAADPRSKQVWPTDEDGIPINDAKIKVYRFDNRLTLGAIFGGAAYR